MPPPPPPVSNRPMIACSLGETLLLSTAGDVLVSRHVAAIEDTSMAMLCFDKDDLTRQIQSDSFCGSWENKRRSQGLLGGSSEVVSQHRMTAPTRTPLVPMEYSPIRRDHTTFTEPSPAKSLVDMDMSRPSTDDGDDQQATISLIQSFDYSQFYEGGNGMLPGTMTMPDTPSPERKYVPVFQENQKFFHGIPTFCKVFSNIKIGAISAHPLGAHALLISKAGLLYSYGANQRGQLGIGVAGDAVERPTIVTPLLENGGKAIACAAGVFHSLVVVENRIGQDQLYGFGRHDVLGLVRPHRSDVLLPRRVQLRGSTKIAASRDHSAAIHNDGSLYVWSVNDKPMPVDIHGERAVDVALGPSTTFVVTESGSCLSAGSSNCGMLGLAEKTDTEQFVKIDIPNSVVGVSAGVTSVVAWTQVGEAYGWGDAIETPQRVPIEAPIVQAAAGRHCSFFVAKNGTVLSCGRASGRLGQGEVTEEILSPRPMYGGLRLWYGPD